MLVMPYLFCSQRLGGRTLRSGSVDKPVMGAFCAGSYEVTPPGRLRATTSSAGPTDRPKDSSTRQAYGESDPAEDVSHILTGLRLGTRAQAVRRDANNGEVVAVLEDGSQVRGEELLVATGRAPVTTELGLASAGVDLTDRGFIWVDDHLRTTADHVWSAGDVAGSPQFTHASWNDFRILKANLDHGDAVTRGRIVPYMLFITPELARVGMTEAQARDKGRNVAIGKIPVSAIPRAKTLHDTTGTWKAMWAPKKSRRPCVRAALTRGARMES
jgi:hypothetical protein